MELYELIARFDSRKSFYHKALVKVEDNGIKTLLSYETPVARVSFGKLELLPQWDCSMTTSRHVREFCRQLNVEDQLQAMKNETRKVK